MRRGISDLVTSDRFPSLAALGLCRDTPALSDLVADLPDESDQMKARSYGRESKLTMRVYGAGPRQRYLFGIDEEQRAAREGRPIYDIDGEPLEACA